MNVKQSGFQILESDEETTGKEIQRLSCTDRFERERNQSFSFRILIFKNERWSMFNMGTIIDSTSFSSIERDSFNVILFYDSRMPLLIGDGDTPSRKRNVRLSNQFMSSLKKRSAFPIPSIQEPSSRRGKRISDEYHEDAK